MTWQAPPLWSVPRAWAGERCFVICGGESVKAQRDLIPRLTGRIIAVKHAALLRPDADVLFWAGERADELAPPVLSVFTGGDIVVRGKGHPVFPAHAKRIGRTCDDKGNLHPHSVLSVDPTRVAGYDAGTSAINLAVLFGATEILVLGMDMAGGRWFNGQIDHYLPQPPESDFQRHMAPLPFLAVDATRKGIRIVNCSPVSRVTCFERQPLEAFL
jgi:hypothetical protein